MRYTPATNEGSVWRPNIQCGVYLVGAPRCGTTALSRVLRRNPQICFSNPKENHYFLLAPADIPVTRFRRNYLDAYYPHLNETHRVIMDGSVTYLYAPGSLQRILQVDPSAKFVAMIRNPVDMVHSFHARLLFTMDEDETDFQQAWRMQETRKLGRNIPRGCRDPQLLQYRFTAGLGTQLENLFDIAGRDRCHVIVFDDFIADPVGVYQKLLNFIGVDDDGQTKFQRKNPNRSFKNRTLQRIFMSPPKFVITSIIRWRLNGKSIFNFVRLIRKRVIQRNRVPVERPTMSDDLRIELRQQFEPEIRKLSVLLHRRLEW